MRDRKNLAADMAWPVVAERESLPQPGMADPMQLAEPRDEFRRDIFWLVMGGLAAFWTCVGIAVANNWSWISATVVGWL